MSTSVKFTTPLVGLEPVTDYGMSPVDGADGLYSLRSEERNDLRLFVLDAAVHLPAYTPVISDEQSARLDLANAAEAAVYVVVNPGKPETTVNLLAPIVLNTRTGLGAQFILDGQDWPVRAPLAAVAALPR